MKILKQRKKPKVLSGQCIRCECQIQCHEIETKRFIDRDSPEGANYVQCPECGHEFLWVN